MGSEEERKGDGRGRETAGEAAMVLAGEVRPGQVTAGVKGRVKVEERGVAAEEEAVGLAAALEELGRGDWEEES